MIHTPSYLATADIYEYWDYASGQWVITDGWYAKSGGNIAYAYKNFDSQSGWTVGLLFRITSTTTDNRAIIAFQNDSTTQTDLRFNAATGLFYVTRNGTILDTGTTTLGISEEVYVEFQSTFADAGGICKVNLNGTSEIDFTGDTNYDSTTTNRVWLSAGNSWFQLKDIYINDNSGGVDDSFWGPINIATQTVATDGTHTDFTPLSSTNASNVDDTSIDGDTTYNYSTTANDIDTFNVTSTGYSTGTVKGVEWVSQVRQVETGANPRIAPVYRINSTDYVGSDIQPSTAYMLLTQQFNQSPDTSSAWTLSELDGMEVGYKRTA